MTYYFSSSSNHLLKFFVRTRLKTFHPISSLSTWLKLIFETTNIPSEKSCFLSMFACSVPMILCSVTWSNSTDWKEPNIFDFISWRKRKRDWLREEEEKEERSLCPAIAALYKRTTKPPDSLHRHAHILSINNHFKHIFHQLFHLNLIADRLPKEDLFDGQRWNESERGDER